MCDCECKDKENKELKEIRDYVIYRCKWNEEILDFTYDYNFKTIDLLKNLIENIDLNDYEIDE